MMWPLVYRQEARIEFDEALDFLERRSPGSGVELIRHLQTSLDRISANPEMFAVALGDVRRANVKKTSYAIYFRITPGSIDIISIFHSSRYPSI